MADEKTYSEQEHIAILADRVAKETTNLTAERDQLQAEKVELENKLDVELSAREAAEAKATETETSFEAFKTEVTEREAAAARKDERITKLREVAKHLDDEFFADEKRIQRVIAMTEDAFTGYLDDMAVSNGGTPAPTSAPRQTAMVGEPVTGGAPVVAGRNFLMRSYVAPKEA